MNILIAFSGVIPALNYGGTERVIWYLGKELIKLGHQVTYFVKAGSSCDFAPLIFLDDSRGLSDQIPNSIDVVHFNYLPEEEISKPYVITVHGNINDYRALDQNTIFVSRDHAKRFGSNSFVHNGLDWDDYGKPNFTNERSYFHFLGNAAWRLKNLQGAIDTIKLTKEEKLKVLGGHRLNFRMGFRMTLSTRVKFCGMVGGEVKRSLLGSSKGLIFPVKWHEPFGLAIIESLYFGCPVFATPYGSLPELVNKEVGFLADNARTLAEAVENSDSYSRSHCHSHAVEEFNSARMAKTYQSKYEKVLNGEKLNSVPPKLIQQQKEKFLNWKS